AHGGSLRPNFINDSECHRNGTPVASFCSRFVDFDTVSAKRIELELGKNKFSPRLVQRRSMIMDSSHTESALPQDFTQFSHAQKLAGLLLILDPENATQIMKQLDER